MKAQNLAAALGAARYAARFVALLAAIALYGCGEPSPTDPRYFLKLPPLPQAWQDLLGEPHWQLEWVNDDGRRRTMTVRGSGGVEISLPQSWASAVSAGPFWPERGIGPGVFRPAGAIFPFDASGRTLPLSWQGGVDAAFYWELANCYYGGTSTNTGVPRMPQNFNWPRFRRLLSDEVIDARVRADPWLANWGDIAERTVRSGFDRRRLTPEARSSLQVPVGPGPWVGTSPFAAPLYFEGIPAFPVRSVVDTWVSAEGLLRANSEAWMFLDW